MTRVFLRQSVARIQLVLGLDLSSRRLPLERAIYSSGAILSCSASIQSVTVRICASESRASR
jgi:hypothetical protein